MPRILIVDNDQTQLTGLKEQFIQLGHSVITTSTSSNVLEIAKKEIPDLIIIELVMKEKDGIDVCTEIRQTPELYKTFIVFRSDHMEDYAQIAAFNAGADDYIFKSTKPRLLEKKITALLGRTKGAVEINQSSEKSAIRIDREMYLVYKGNKKINLPKKEFELLSLLIKNQNTVVTRQVIGMQIWGEEIEYGNRTIDVHIRNLRVKLETDNIKTINKVGYCFEAHNETQPQAIRK